MRARTARVLERVFVAVGVAGVLSLGLHKVARVHAEQAAARVVAEPAATPASTARVRSGDVLGQISLPRLGVNLPVLEDCNAQTLHAGSCRIRESAQIGGLGTVGIAAHRESSFHALGTARRGDTIHVTTASGTFVYTVDATSIVQPRQVEVLDAADRPQLVLITCYPFHWIGPAPRRFVVSAHLQSIEPAPQGSAS